jgi:hypothetical protein
MSGSAGFGIAVTATMCKFLPTATLWRLPDAITLPPASSTVSVTLPPTRSANHTVTLLGVTLRSTGPASTWGLVASVALSDCQGTIEPYAGVTECGQRWALHRTTKSSSGFELSRNRRLAWVASVPFEFRVGCLSRGAPSSPASRREVDIRSFGRSASRPNARPGILPTAVRASLSPAGLLLSLITTETDVVTLSQQVWVQLPDAPADLELRIDGGARVCPRTSRLRRLT